MSAARPRSVRARLIALVLAITAAAWIGAAWVGYRESRHEADEIFDAHLAQAASLLIAQVGDEIEELEIEHAPALHRYARNVAFQVWEDGRRLRVHSDNAPSARLSRVDEGFADSVIDGRAWRVFSAWDREGEFLIQVGELASAREAVSRELGGHLLMPLALALPVLAVALWWAIGRGLAPLESVRAEVAARDGARLAPLAAEGVPREIAPLVEQLNALMARIGRSLEAERRFTADAAHELRTPLAAIRAQVQVARGAAQDATRARALDQAIGACDRATRLVEQLLTLARLDAAAGLGEPQAVDLRDVAAEVLAEIAPRALAKGVELSLEEGGASPARGHSELLRVLLRNLLDNAVRYTPPGGRVSASVSSHDGSARGCVDDSGPGIPEAQRAELMQRFSRAAGTDEEGTGLGLSIARRIAQIHGGDLALERSPLGGLRARFDLPRG